MSKPATLKGTQRAAAEQPSHRSPFTSPSPLAVAIARDTINGN